MARFSGLSLVLLSFAMLAAPALAGRHREGNGPVGEPTFARVRLTESSIPEPGALAVFALGAAAVGVVVRRSRRQA